MWRSFGWQAPVSIEAIGSVAPRSVSGRGGAAPRDRTNCPLSWRPAWFNKGEISLARAYLEDKAGAPERQSSSSEGAKFCVGAAIVVAT
jgi:hypothetical protein